MNNVQFIISGEEPCKKRLLTVNLLTPEKKGGVKSAPPPGVPADLKSAVKKSSTY